MKPSSPSRRALLRSAGALGALAALKSALPAYAQYNFPAQADPNRLPELGGNTIDLVIAETSFRVGGRETTAITVNGTVPGPLLRLREGQDVTLRVTNLLRESSSIHWHGILLPAEMDGVPGVSFPGIAPGETFVYRFPLRQSGTYWYHSHSMGQEQAGAYAPLIVEPLAPDPVRCDREYVVMLSDWSFTPVAGMIGRLKKQSGYYNYQKRTLADLVRDMGRKGWHAALDDYLMWADMRMDPTDLADVTGAAYTFLMNGLPPQASWTGLFHPGERVRLRFIQVGVMSFHDVRIPGLRMTVVQADGQNVQPVEVDEFRIGPAETYDVVVEPAEDRAYAIFAESLDRSGYACGTLAPRPGMRGEVPARRPRPVRTMADMGMRAHGMHGAHDTGQMHADHAGQDGHGHGSAHDTTGTRDAGLVPHGPDDHGPGNQTVPDFTRPRLDEPGVGLGGDGRRVLTYRDLRSLVPYPDQREPERELEIHLTGHMERFIWSFDGRKFSQAREPIRFRHGERLRWTFVNDTMMEHTMHLHGMWMHLENGAGAHLPRKHTVIVKPAERISVAITADAPGHWAFHCHLLLHMETGMFRIVHVSDPPADGSS